MKKLQVSIVVNSQTDPSEANDLVLELDSVGITSEIQQDQGALYWNSSEWLIPTAIILVFGKPYIEEIAKGMAKDHYLLAKKLSKKIWEKCFGPKKSVAMELRTIDGSLKETIFCRGISFRTRVEDKIDVALLFKEGQSANEIENSIESFLIMLTDKSKIEEFKLAVGKLPEFAQSHQQLIYFNSATNEIEVIDWVTSSQTCKFTSFPINRKW